MTHAGNAQKVRFVDGFVDDALTLQPNVFPSPQPAF